MRMSAGTGSMDSNSSQLLRLHLETNSKEKQLVFNIRFSWTLYAWLYLFTKNSWTVACQVSRWSLSVLQTTSEQGLLLILMRLHSRTLFSSFCTFFGTLFNTKLLRCNTTATKTNLHVQPCTWISFHVEKPTQTMWCRAGNQSRELRYLSPRAL